MPNQIGSSPSYIAAGNAIGTMINMMETDSRNIPKITNSSAYRHANCQSPRPREFIMAPIDCTNPDDASMTVSGSNAKHRTGQDNASFDQPKCNDANQ